MQTRKRIKWESLCDNTPDLININLSFHIISFPPKEEKAPHKNIIFTRIEGQYDNALCQTWGTNSSTQHYTAQHDTAHNCTTMDYNALHYTTLHYISMHYTTLHYISKHYTTIHYTTIYQCVLWNYLQRMRGPPDFRWEMDSLSWNEL